MRRVKQFRSEELSSKGIKLKTEDQLSKEQEKTNTIYPEVQVVGNNSTSSFGEAEHLAPKSPRLHLLLLEPSPLRTYSPTSGGS